MVKKEEVYKATNNGLDIITFLYPDARRLVESGKLNEAFKLRPNERTPSAHMKLKDDHWIVTDFGDDQQPRNPIDLVMKEKGFEFKEAIAWIVSELNLTVDTIQPDVNRPMYEKRVQAEPDWPEGSWQYELNETFTEKELEVMGPLVDVNHVSSLHWHSVKWVGKVKDRLITKKYSTPTYPIFLRECVYVEGGKEMSFFKKYEPLSFDKQYRFMYIGSKPRDYVNGLYELRKEWERYNAAEQEEWEADPKNEDKPYKQKKLDNVVICSGERDSLCARSLGYNPLWLNSETAQLDAESYKEIMKYTDVLYNIPDKDETGIRRGTVLALTYIDIRTIWLPRRFEQFKDNRRRFRKDFKDWLELQREPFKAFKALVAQALPARFWQERVNKKSGETSYQISSISLQYFLRLQGFFKLKDRDADRVDFVRVRGNIVEHVNTGDISEFLTSWAAGNEPRIDDPAKHSDVQPHDVQNLIIDSPRTSPAALDKLASVELDFTNYTPKSQLFFFQNGSVEVTGSGIRQYELNESSSLQRYVWEENVIKHAFKPLPDMFRISRNKDEEGKDEFDIEVCDTRSKVFCYVINSSRLHWRKELEESLANVSEENRNDYLSSHRFNISSTRLNAFENQQQRQCLLNKIFTIGYMLHAYKSPSRAWAPMALDWRIDDDGECNGRSGKSFLFSQVIYRMIKTVKLSGRNAKLMDNPHVFEQVTRHTRQLLIDDCDRRMNTGMFYDNITSDMTVNPKNNHQYTIPFAESPKIVFTTNYVPNDFDASSEARLLYVVFSDYYHQQTPDNDYHGSWSIRDDFHKDLFGVDYTEEEWNADFNFMLQCERFYLSVAADNVKILPPMDNIIQRKFRQDMAGNFQDWAEAFFAPDSDHLDKLLCREEVVDDLKRYTGLKDITTNGFSKKLIAFVKWCPYTTTVNPADLCSKPPTPGKMNGRIMRRKKDSMGLETGNPVDHIYIKTDPAALEAYRQDLERKKQALVIIEREADLPPLEHLDADPDDDTPF